MGLDFLAVGAMGKGMHARTASNAFNASIIFFFLRVFYGKFKLE